MQQKPPFVLCVVAIIIELLNPAEHDVSGDFQLLPDI